MKKLTIELTEAEADWLMELCLVIGSTLQHPFAYKVGPQDQEAAAAILLALIRALWPAPPATVAPVTPATVSEPTGSAGPDSALDTRSAS